MPDDQQVKDEEQDEAAEQEHAEDTASQDGGTDGGEGGEGGPESEAQEAAQKSAKEREEAEEQMHELEQQDDLPSDLEDWPDGKAKYITYGGQEGESGYEEGPTSKLGPSSLRRHEGGEISIEGEKVDNPDDYKAEPIPGGPTDPNTADLPGERRVQEKQEANREKRQAEAQERSGDDAEGGDSDDSGDEKD